MPEPPFPMHQAAERLRKLQGRIERLADNYEGEPLLATLMYSRHDVGRPACPIDVPRGEYGSSKSHPSTAGFPLSLSTYPAPQPCWIWLDFAATGPFSKWAGGAEDCVRFIKVGKDADVRYLLYGVHVRMPPRGVDAADNNAQYADAADFTPTRPDLCEECYAVVTRSVESFRSCAESAGRTLKRLGPDVLSALAGDDRLGDAAMDDVSFFMASVFDVAALASEEADQSEGSDTASEEPGHDYVCEELALPSEYRWLAEMQAETGWTKWRYRVVSDLYRASAACLDNIVAALEASVGPPEASPTEDAGLQVDLGPVDCQTPRVALYGLGRPARVDDKIVPKLTDTQYPAVKLLIETYPVGVSMKGLAKASLDGDNDESVRRVLERLKEKPRWQNVLVFPGKERNGGYRIAEPDEST